MTRNNVYVDGEPLVGAEHDLEKYSQHCLLRIDGEEGPTFDDPDTSIDVDISTDEDTGKTVAVIFQKEAIFSEDDIRVEMNVESEQYEPDFDRKLNVYIYGTEV